VRPQRHRDVELRGALQALRAVARRVQQLTREERELAREIDTLTRTLAPQLRRPHLWTTGHIAAGTRFIRR
jgi:hypothetical protein